ncbi:MAG: tRNA (adenosine(37)-N6)-dimethylallyltransferase MiaA, partial [Pseudomonadota bacterium]
MIMGPTASGKTALACALTRSFPLEIISVDSAQVFRQMNIGTAKPDAATLAHYPHQLIDLISPLENYSAARFCADAHEAIKHIRARGKIPLLVGGTMLYFKALIEGLAELPEADATTRSALEEEAKKYGWATLHQKLARLDPETAARLESSDAQRIQRALEIIQLTGQSMS